MVRIQVNRRPTKGKASIQHMYNDALKNQRILLTMFAFIMGCTSSNEGQPHHTIDQFVLDAVPTLDEDVGQTLTDMQPMHTLDAGLADSHIVQDTALPANDMTETDTSVTCRLEDCGLRVPELVDECSGAADEFLLVGCEPDASNVCRWVFTECPEDPPCVGTTCEEPCEPWSFFDAGDGCNRCQCGPSMSRQDAHCSTFDCSETGCRYNDDCDEGQYCNFGDNRCGIEGRRGQCEPLTADCIVEPNYTCGCDGTYGVNSCALLTQTGIDQMPYGGCNIPDLGDAVACGPSVCLGDEFFCQIDLDDPSMPLQMNSSCQPIPPGCIQGDCSCFTDKLSTHACFNGGGFVVMIQRTPNPND